MVIVTGQHIVFSGTVRVTTRSWVARETVPEHVRDLFDDLVAAMESASED